MQLRKYSVWTTWIALILTVSFGVYTVIAFKWQNRQKAPKCDGCEPEIFVGALLQTTLMMIAESFGALIYFIDHQLSKRKEKPPFMDVVVNMDHYEQPGWPWYWWAIPSLCDFGGTLLCNLGMTMTYAATVQMLRNFMVVIAALLQLILIRRALRVHEFIGVAIITSAMVLTAVPAILTPDSSIVDNSRAWLGIIFAVLGTTVQALQLLMEDFILRKGYFSPMLGFGVEGLVGIVICGVAWPIFQATGWEDVTGSWYQLGHSWQIGVITALYIPACTSFNAVGIVVCKLAGGLLRAICYAARAPLVWIITVAVGWQSFDYWNLASVLVFLVGFTFHRALFITPERTPRLHRVLKRPVPCFCTNSEKDRLYEDYQPRDIETDDRSTNVDSLEAAKAEI